MTPLQDRDAGLLDVKLLRLFEQLYTTRSVSRAAEQLGQAQPTISIWLRQLRSSLGDPLFVRTPEGMEPTPRAERLIGTVRAVLEALRSLSEEPEFQPAEAQRHFRICMTDASHVTMLPRLLGKLREEAPQVRLEAKLIDRDVVRLLQAADADLAIGFIPELEGGFYQQTFFAQDWVCLANSRHPRIGDKLTKARYEREGHIGIVSGTGHGLLRSALDASGIRRQILLELPGFLGLGAIISSTDLIATLPRQTGEVLAETYGLRLMPCPFPIPSFTVKQHWHARQNHDPANRWLRSLCAKLFQHHSRQPIGVIR